MNTAMIAGWPATGRPGSSTGPMMAVVAFFVTLAALLAWDMLNRPAAAPPFDEVEIVLSGGDRLKVGRFEITHALWAQCHAAGACEFLPRSRRRERGGDYPVTGINRIDADQFVAWINRHTGLGYRLPSLAEWREFAGVSPDEGKRKRFTDPRLAWAADYGSARTYSRGVRPSGHFGVAKSGVADTGGNVWEWTSTCAADTPDPTRCPAFVAAGEHEAEIPIFLRDAYGGGCSTGVPPANLGLRLVRN